MVMRIILAGGVRTRERQVRWRDGDIWNNGVLKEEARCPYCEQPDTPAHRWWFCTKWRPLRHHGLQPTQDWPPCLLQRGILPAGDPTLEWLAAWMPAIHRTMVDIFEAGETLEQQGQQEAPSVPPPPRLAHRLKRKTAVYFDEERQMLRPRQEVEEHRPVVQQIAAHDPEVVAVGREAARRCGLMEREEPHIHLRRGRPKRKRPGQEPELVLSCSVCMASTRATAKYQTLKNFYTQHAGCPTARQQKSYTPRGTLPPNLFYSSRICKGENRQERVLTCSTCRASGALTNSIGFVKRHTDCVVETTRRAMRFIDRVATAPTSRRKRKRLAEALTGGGS